MTDAVKQREQNLSRTTTHVCMWMHISDIFKTPTADQSNCLYVLYCGVCVYVSSETDKNWVPQHYKWSKFHKV